jgi:hypothetical protein
MPDETTYTTDDVANAYDVLDVQNATPEELAYQAGQAALTEPAERRTLAACPFDPGTDERDAWIRGFADALESQPSVEDLRAELNGGDNA